MAAVAISDKIVAIQNLETNQNILTHFKNPIFATSKSIRQLFSNKRRQIRRIRKIRAIRPQGTFFVLFCVLAKLEYAFFPAARLKSGSFSAISNYTCVISQSRNKNGIGALCIWVQFILRFCEMGLPPVSFAHIIRACKNIGGFDFAFFACIFQLEKNVYKTRTVCFRVFYLHYIPTKE